MASLASHTAADTLAKATEFRKEFRYFDGMLFIRKAKELITVNTDIPVKVGIITTPTITTAKELCTSLNQPTLNPPMLNRPTSNQRTYTP
jgi:hypothetical protein